MFLTAVTWNHFHCKQGITRQILSPWSFLRNSTDLQNDVLILMKSKVLFGKGKQQKDITDIPIQYKDIECMYCQQLNPVLQFFLLNSHLSSRIVGKQLLASEVISVIKANWPHFKKKKKRNFYSTPANRLELDFALPTPCKAPLLF